MWLLKGVWRSRHRWTERQPWERNAAPQIRRPEEGRHGRKFALQEQRDGGGGSAGQCAVEEGGDSLSQEDRISPGGVELLSFYSRASKAQL